MLFRAVTPTGREVLRWLLRLALVALIIAAVLWQVHNWGLPKDYEYPFRNGRYSPSFVVVVATLGLAINVTVDVLKRRASRAQRVSAQTPHPRGPSAG